MIEEFNTDNSGDMCPYRIFLLQYGTIVYGSTSSRYAPELSFTYEPSYMRV